MRKAAMTSSQLTESLSDRDKASVHPGGAAVGCDCAST